jgi:hypothetical protein
MMNKDQLIAYQEVRKVLIERLRRLEFTGTMLDQLDKLSTFQLVSLLYLMAGHCNYLSTMTISVRTLEELFGDIIWDKPGQEEPPKVEEPKPAVVH